MSGLPTLESLDVTGKTVLVRLDLNVPMQAGRVTDATRITRVVPTLQYLMERHAKVVILSHLGRPKGKFDPSQSLAPLLDALSAALWDRPVKFAPDCIGNSARRAVEGAEAGDVILMENLRFHKEEEANDPEFAKAIASLGDCYVNDAFSCSHRAHASIVGLNPYMPAAAGRLMQEEVQALEGLSNPARPMTAIVGGSKVSTKLELLGNLVAKVDNLVIGGAMANTFLAAQGIGMGASLCENEMAQTARDILAAAMTAGCRIILPTDAVVAKRFKAHAENIVCDVHEIPSDGMILDIGPRSLLALQDVISGSRTLVWNGPVGAFETAPFDATTVQIARMVAAASRSGTLHSVAGGGDTVAALAHAGVTSQLSYLSTAGGAFLEWLEGKELPGIAALMSQQNADRKRA